MRSKGNDGPTNGLTPVGMFEPLPERSYLDELEFSDYGRDARFLPAWWILPVLALATMFAVWIARVL